MRVLNFTAITFLAWGIHFLYAQTSFVHPGLWHTQADLNRMKANVAAGLQPWKAGFDTLKNHAQSKSTYVMRGPFANVARNPDSHKTEMENDGNAAYQNAVMWAVTGDSAHARKAVEILDGWSAALRTFGGADSILAAGIYGQKFVNAAEILRYTYGPWPPANIARVETMFRNVFYPVIKNFATFANGNWETACILTMEGIGVFVNDTAIFNRAVNWYYNGAGNGSITHYVINETGQCQESGRDQTHTQLGLAHLAGAAEIAWNQGLDLYGAFNNRLLKGFEYTASYNLGNTVPFQEYTDITGKYHQTVISATTRGEFRPVFEMVYNHYVNRRGLSAPYAKQVADRLRPEGAAFQADHPGFGTILFSRATVTSAIFTLRSQRGAGEAWILPAPARRFYLFGGEAKDVLGRKSVLRARVANPK